MTETLDRLNAQPTSQGRTTVLAEVLQLRLHFATAVPSPGRQAASRIRRALPSAWAAQHRSRLAEVAVASAATANGGSSP
jgi:hypothetical protein